MPLINCEVNLILTWSSSCVIVYTDVANQDDTFAITKIKLHVPVVTLSTQDNAKLLPQLKSGFKKLLPQLKSGFKRTITWNKYLWKPELLTQNPNLNHLVELRVQGISRLFVLAFENETQKTSVKYIMSQM